MSLKIYSYPGNYRVWKALIAAQYNGVEIECPAFDFKTAKADPKFQALTPVGKVPVLETPQGSVFESNAIAKYVARLRADTGLLGNSFFESAQVDQWLDWCALELEGARAVWLLPIFEMFEFNGKAYAEAKKDVGNALNVLNTHLLKNTFLVGHQITLADIVVACSLVDLFKMVLTPGFLKAYGNVVRWFTTCINQPQFVTVIGTVEFAKQEKMAPKPSKPVAEKKEQPKKEQPKKEAAPAAAPEPKKEKPKSAVEMLPESPMIMDAEKKAFFCQRPFNKDYFDQLFSENRFDSEGYSFWIAKYKFDDENTVLFMTGNLLAGFLQRLEAARKYAFGSMFITAKDEDTPPFKVGAIFMFRGQVVPQEVIDGGDAEYYTWTKVENPAAEKAKIVEYWTADTVQGENVIDRRFFK